MLGIAAAIGVMCFAILAISGQYFAKTVPEWLPQLLWLIAVLGGSVACGYKSPVRAWRWGAVIAAVQPVAALVLLSAVGALGNPSSSTGGMAAVFIFAVLAVLVSPIAILASYFGSRRAAQQPVSGR